MEEPTTLSPSPTTLLTQLVEGLELWHTSEREAFVTIEINGHEENWRIESNDFRNWLDHRFYEELRRAPKHQWVQEVVNNLRAKALFDGDEHQVFIRVGESGESIFLDLCNDQWEAVEIDRFGWKVIFDPPIKFRRSRAMSSLPPPSTRQSRHAQAFHQYRQ